jgi:hypothetical protein
MSLQLGEATATKAGIEFDGPKARDPLVWVGLSPVRNPQ